MTPNELKSAVNAIRPLDSLRETMIRDGSRTRWRGLKKILIAAASFLLVLTGALGIPFWVGQNGGEFGGFSVLLAAEDGQLSPLEPEVTMPLGSYSMLMSSVPGFPFCVELKGSDGGQVLVKADRGELLTWGKDGVVTGHGGSGRFAVGTTLYWSPLNKDQTFADGAVITLSAHRNGKEIPLGWLEIIAEGDSSFYFISYHKD